MPIFVEENIQVLAYQLFFIHIIITISVDVEDMEILTFVFGLILSVSVNQSFDVFVW